MTMKKQDKVAKIVTELQVKSKITVHCKEQFLQLMEYDGIDPKDLA